MQNIDEKLKLFRICWWTWIWNELVLPETFSWQRRTDAIRWTGTLWNHMSMAA